MKLSREKALNVARLARLKLADEEEEIFSSQLSAVLDHIARLNEMDTDNVEPTSHALDLANVLRDDKVEKAYPPDSWKSNAPSAEHGHLRAPRIIEG